MIDVERSNEAPASLAVEVGWSSEDVLRTLHRDFLGKCYLCERTLSIGEIEIDHRRHRSDGDDGHYQWTNLFPACGYCNNRRPKKYPPSGLLSPGDRVETRISQRAMLEADGLLLRCEFQSRNIADAAAVNTAQELQHVHSVETATTDRAKFAARDMLDVIHDRYLADVRPLEIKILRAHRNDERDEAAEAKLRAAVSRHAPFTMLTRSLVHPTLSDLFD